MTDYISLAVIIATADRPDSLAETLAGLASCELPEPVLRVIVADNGIDEGTGRVCRRNWPGLRVRHLEVSEGGKTTAQNRAVEVTDAQLLAFTDDDVEFDARWLVELRRAAEEWPKHVLFGGRVLPLWPNGPEACPPRLKGSTYLGPLYTLLDRGDVEGPLVGFRPFGPNMAARRSAFERGIRFDESIGPGSPDGVSMGDESDFARRLAALGETPVYVPESRVYHRVREEQLTLTWQLKRGVRYGRMLAHFEGPTSGPHLWGVPRWLYRQAAASLVAVGWHGLLGHRRRAFDRLMDTAVAIGRGRARARPPSP